MTSDPTRSRTRCRLCGCVASESVFFLGDEVGVVPTRRLSVSDSPDGRMQSSGRAGRPSS